MTKRILIIGGTSEASHLAKELDADPAFEPILSLAGRTKSPKKPILQTRIGGFGGVDGLVRYLSSARIAGVIDASHPFAAQISQHVAAASEAVTCPLLGLRRPPWRRQAGDNWTVVSDMAAAVTALPTRPSRVFLTIGRLDCNAFAHAPQHSYLLRTLDPLDAPPLLSSYRWIQDRPPFSVTGELALLEAHKIDILVSKNAGSQATYAKIAAARAAQLPVIVIDQPTAPQGAEVRTVAAALAWLRHHF